MTAKLYRKIAIIMLAAAVMCAPVSRGQENDGVLQSAEEGGSQETNPPETNPPETNPPETNPPETNPPETNPPETNPPETNPPETNPPETNPPETNLPETNPPETNPPETTAQTDSADNNHSTAIPENPTEKKLKQKIVDAGEEDGYSVSINGGAPVVIEPEKPFREVVNAITGGSYGYRMDYKRPGTGLRESIDIEPENSITAIFNKVKAMPGAGCEIVLYINNGNTLWLNMNVQGSLDTEDAAIIFASVPGTEPCKITYDANGGALTDSITSIRRKGEWISRFDVKASKDGVYFCGWYDGPNEDARRVFPTDEVKKDMTLYAHYNPYGVVTCAFDFGFSTPGDPGSLVHRLIVPIQEDGTYGIVQYPVIERDGKVIKGWKDESGNTAAQTGLTGSRTFTAEWGDASEIENEVQPESQSEPGETVAETETEA